MRMPARRFLDGLFTFSAATAVALIVASLVAVLGPMIWRGSGAVVFQATCEFRRMQLDLFSRGDSSAVQSETRTVADVRRNVYAMLDRFSGGDPAELIDRARRIHRQVGAQLANRELPREQLASLKALSKDLRDTLQSALEEHDRAAALAKVDQVLARRNDPQLADTAAAEYFSLADEARSLLNRPVLDAKLTRSLDEVRQEVRALLGPRPGEPLPAVEMEQYGCTRWDQAQEHLQRLLWAQEWSGAAGQKMTSQQVSREQQFAGTELAPLFPYMRNNLHAMLLPQWTFYWQYFVEDSVGGHYFGGVGPEILGTLLVTLLSVAFALPLGVVAAAYLVESAGENVVTNILRTCINTLAGVPSIVFGLFGMAFFVIYLLPRLGLRDGSSILAGSLTLALLILPVIIRASEEAIRAVPQAYKEASLSLGASPLKCFLTVTLPSALPGILTGLILSMSRAAGETAPILFTAGVAMGPIPTSLMQPTRTLSYSCYDMAVGDKMAALAPHNQYGMVLTLVAIVLILNVAAIVLRGRIARKLRGQ